MYSELFGDDRPLPKPFPCTEIVRGDQDVICDKKRAPSKQDIDAEKREFKALLAKMQKMNAGTAAWRKKWAGTSHTEVVKWPVCGGKLHLSIASINSHVHGRCEGDCGISWKE